MAITYIVCERALVIFKENDICARKISDNLKPYASDILKIESQIEFLQEQMTEDVKKKNELLAERRKRYEQSKLVAEIGLGGSASVSAVAALIGVDTISATVSNLVTKSTPIFLTSLLITLLFSSYPCSLSPSDDKINGFNEKIIFEQEYIEILQQKLEEINKSFDNKQYVYDSELHIIDDSENIKYLSDSIKLRYIFGSNFEKVKKYFNRGMLFKYLKEEGFCEDAIADFIIFVERKNSLEQREIEKELNLLKSN